jgi:hypothetical protein
VRAELRATVERELSRVVSGVVRARTTPSKNPSHATLTAVDPQQFTASTQTISVSTSNASISRAARSKPLWGWAVAALLVVGGGVAALFAQSSPGVQAERASAIRAAASATVAPEPQSVQVALRSNPPTATLFLDGKPIVGNPAEQVLPKNGAVHVVRAELSGHRPATAEFSATRDAVVELTLQELPSEPAASARKARAASSPKKTAPKPALRESPCAQPFIVDAEGIKKVKPNCF